jgi:Type ISP C-terminal specificity domain
VGAYAKKLSPVIASEARQSSPLVGQSGLPRRSAPRNDEFGRVQINPDQYFEGVPLTAWEFHIGGYQPAQKWLKDRKGRALSFDDVIHYQKIIKILCETDRIMKEIELPL